ncbi:pyridoxamine 5'-phosphate oxidase family protein [Defluviimonas sp. D31]|uniref:HugZ family pyridoxamine 5'-phosphate oxidase n=1 Tax=Defluviimonas sp. D31 TaxID=3083253 RepID=UPI00296F586A|nr:pyridoxamine 5'-phosphate oxidase family protein [Defluviimonas sp. D31]MDW4551131.1 pyridoxamine 5'-phosphate oxidase family protein [Defluviimonas sp. D31]
MSDKINPIRETDDEARGLARDLLTGAATAALGVIEPGSGAPFVSRIAFGLGPQGEPMTLVSDLAVHARALRADPRASLLIGAPGPKGDPLTHPRLTLRASARFVARDDGRRDALRAVWLGHHPKAKLYVDFDDFHFVLFDIADGLLNGGFAKAYALDANDLRVI